MGKENIRITFVKADSLKASEYNPRRRDEAAAQQLKESVKKYGLVDPLIANSAPQRKNILIGGHFRLAVAKELGIQEVPVVYLNIPDIEKEKELNLRLNRNVGEWDWELLKELDLNLLLNVGFDDQDLSNIWDNTLETEEDNFDVEKEIAEIKEPKVRIGDLYQLGNHRLICGDSTDPETVKRLVGKNKIGIIYCDPVYNIGLSYDSGIGGKQKYGGTANDNKTDTEYGKFLKDTMENALAVSEKDCHVFYWCDQNYIGLIQNIYAKLGLHPRRVCLWIKNNQNATPQVAFNKAYEPCVYATRGKPYISSRITNLNEILNKETGTGNRLPEDILDLFDIWLVKRLPTIEYEHPTQKPVTLNEKPLRRCSKPGDAVLDLFGGSGSTLIACEQMKRRCFMAELDPVFCEVIIKRYESLSGKSAKLIRNEKSNGKK
ncbi:MAG: DNA methyltransferase [Parcubacteria group bacterium]|jgi:DNA modification methylase